ncbi:MAG: hypothetical protein JW913_20870 [Chitinispirillaceae bacterium]|nr:hypothetical protein [Chitinispirillaceae bacterium]
MNAEDKRRVIRGEVFCEGRWVHIDRKFDIERQRRKKIEAGYVYHHGEWITIDEKLSRVVPPKPPEEKRAETIIINQYDNRTIHHHEHRHVHIDREGLEEYSRHRLTDNTTGDTPLIEADRNKVEALPGKKESDAVVDGRKIKGLLKPPEDTG